MSGTCIMIGPDPEGLGGISRVVKNIKKDAFFEVNAIVYIPSVNEVSKSKFLFLLSALLQYISKAFLLKNGRVHIHTASFNSFYRKSLFLLLSIVLGKKVILHVHPSFFVTFISSFQGFKKRFFFFLLDGVNTFVVLTRQMQQDMNLLFPGKSVVVLRNPVDVAELQAPYGINREYSRFLFLGWFTPGKGVYDLVNAAELLIKDGEHFFIDFYGTKNVGQLRSYIAEKGMAANLLVHGWADDKQKIAALHRSTALVLPSHTEGIPNVVLEAMAARTPVISTMVGGLSEILRDRENSLVIEPKNSQDIAEKIRFALHHPEHCRKCADTAYQDIVKEYDLPLIQKQLKTLLAG